jgi:lipoprotein NlpD
VVLAGCSNGIKKWDPSDYTVKSGDTIYGIAWRYELDVEEFVAWNGLAASNLIKPGQRLHTRRPANFDASRHAEKARGIVLAPQVTAVPIQPDKNPDASSSNKKQPAIAGEQRSAVPKWVKAHKGDTLYGISKRSGVSVERLAKLNQLKKPYTIQPGQTIFLKPLNTPVKADTTVTNKTGVTKTGMSRKDGIAQGAMDGGAIKTHAPASHQAGSQQTHWPGTVRWQRPAKGKVIKKFNRQRNDAKGISIAGKLGNAIVAAADGKVVYSGDGLISYGKLIIIKHNKTFLSAYAYNRKLLVQEGEIVKSGQKIAEMGRKDKLSPRLHFEIRKNGKPVDPLKYLPW